jgi:soluble lytic murein transglycosylase-like protein
MLGAVVLSMTTLDPIIMETSARYGIDPALIKAHIKAESNWDVNASRFEAHKTDASWGLMQLMLATAREILGKPDLTTTQLIQPRINIDAGAKYLRKQLDRYGGNIKSAIAAYNAGSARFDKNGKYVNQSYVDKVLANQEMYKKLGFAVAKDDFIPTGDNVATYTYLAIGLGTVAFFLSRE